MKVGNTDLEMVVELGTSSGVYRRVSADCSASEDAWRRLEGLIAREALVHAGEICIPGGVHGLGVLPPVPVHLLRIVGVGAVCERVVGGRRLGGGEMASRSRCSASEVLGVLCCARQSTELTLEHAARRRGEGERRGGRRKCEPCHHRRPPSRPPVASPSRRRSQPKQVIA